VIAERTPAPPVKADTSQAQMSADEELARQLQAQDGKRAGPAPNLFASPDGQLKSTRRGRPQKSSTLPAADLNAVDLNAVSPPPAGTTSPAPVQPPPRTTSAPMNNLTPQQTGFDDDAWSNRPSSTKPLTPTPAQQQQHQQQQAAPARAPSAPPVQQQAPPAPAPPAPTPPAAAPPRAASAAPGGLARTTENDVFDQLARLAELRVRTPAAPTPPAPAPLTSPPPASYASGLGVGAGGSLGQHLQAQATGVLPPLGPRGPLAPVPANQVRCVATLCLFLRPCSTLSGRSPGLFCASCWVFAFACVIPDFGFRCRPFSPPCILFHLLPLFPFAPLLSIIVCVQCADSSF
jgi:hypothetical protein